MKRVKKITTFEELKSEEWVTIIQLMKTISEY